MNTRFLLLAISVAALSSCSSVYKSGQTPDDVYYSPAPVRIQGSSSQQGDDSYVNVRQQKAGSNYQSYEQYQDNYRDDRFLRMSVGNPYYMNAYNSYGAFDWRSNSFYDGYNYGFSSPWNNYFAWNNFYNPYSSGIYLGYGGLGYSNYYGGGGYYAGGYGGGGYYGGGVKYSSVAPISKPRVFNVSSYSNSNSRGASRTYTNGNYNNVNQRYNNTNNNRASNNNSYYNNSNNNRNSNSYTPPSNSNNNNYAPTRSYTPAPSGGGGSSSGGGGGGVSRPARGN